MYRTTMLATFLLLASHVASGRTEPVVAGARPASHDYSTAAIDRYIRDQMRRQKIPGFRSP